MSGVGLGLKILKIGMSAFVKNDLIKEIAEELGDAGIDKVEEFCKKYLDEINHLLALDDKEIEKQNIPKEKRCEIRENITEFIRDVDIEQVARDCLYDETKLGAVLADVYMKTYEQDSEYGYRFHQRMLYSLSNYAMESIKSDPAFERNLTLESYRILIKLQEIEKENTEWKKDDKEFKKEVLEYVRGSSEEKSHGLLKKAYPHIITDSPAEVDRNSFMKQKDVEKLYEKIKTEKCILLVNGIGGVGKTSVAKALFHKVKNEYAHIGWVEYNGSLKESILNCCNLFPETKDTEERFELISAFFNNDSTKILFIDNVDKTQGKDKLLQDITGMNMSIVLTSRINRIAPYICYEIKFLSVDECIELFYSHCEHLEQGVEKETVRLLVNMVQCHTLSVELLAKSYTPRVTLKKFYENLKEKGFSYPRLKTYTAHTDGTHTIAQHLKLLFNLENLNEEERGTEKVRILANFALMPSINIPGSVCDWIDADDNDMGYLVQRGWLSAGNGAYYMHPIIKETILLQKERFPQDTGGEFLLCINNDEYFEDEDNFADILNKLDIADYFMSNISDSVELDKFPDLHFNLAYVFYDQGKYEKALRYYEKSLEISKKTYGEEHVSVATSYNNMGMLYKVQGEYEKALRYYEKSLEISKKTYGEEHPSVATSYNNMGMLYDSLGEYEKALRYYEKSLEIRKKTYGEEHPDVAMSYNNIAGVHYAQGEYEKALWYYEKSLEIRKKTYGEEHPDVATSYNNMGGVYDSQGEYEKALRYYEKSLEISKKTYGEEHVSVATSYNNMGMLYDSLGEYEKALEYYNEALRILYKVFGDYHPYITTTYGNIAEVYLKQNDIKMALEYMEKCPELMNMFSND